MENFTFFERFMCVPLVPGANDGEKNIEMQGITLIAEQDFLERYGKTFVICLDPQKGAVLKPTSGEV